MAVLAALRRTTNGLARNPVLFAAVGIYVLFQIPLFAGQVLGSLVALAASSLFSFVFVLVTPFFQGGLVAMADEALDGRTRLETLTARGREHYVTMLVAYLLLVGVNTVVGIVAFAGLFVGGVFVLATMESSGSVSPVVLAVAGVAGLLVAVLYVAFVFLVQFYGQAIVVDGADAIDSFLRSARLVRGNLASALGYTVLVAVVGGLFGTLAGVASVLTSTQPSAVPALPELSTAGTVGLLAAVLVLGISLSTFTTTFSVAFYRTLRPDAAD